MRRRFLLAIALVPLVLVDASPVMAHSDKGRLALQATRAGQPLGVQVRARLVFANDGDPVSTATVTVEATGPNGQTVAPRALASEGDGVYTTVLGLPVAGTWTLRANVLEPEADAEIPFEAVAAPPTTVAATTTTTTTSVPAALRRGGHAIHGRWAGRHRLAPRARRGRAGLRARRRVGLVARSVSCESIDWARQLTAFQA